MGWRDKIDSSKSTGWRNKAEQTSQPENTQYLEESPDALSWGDRAIAKNFANSPEAQAAYIRQQYPNQQVTLKDGNIYMRGNNQEPWKAMDPDTGFFSKDIINDAGDILYDTGAGMVQSAATAASALAGGAATLPSGGWGAIPAAMAGSSASGAAIEAGRQQIGKWAGIPQEIDGGQVGMSGLIGAAAPLVFGAGNITKAPALLNATKSKLAEYGDDGLRMLQSQQRGLPGRFMDWAGKNMSMVPKNAIEWYSKYGQKGLDDINNNHFGLYSEISNAAQQVDGVGNKLVHEAGQKIDDVYRGSNATANIKGAMSAYDDEIAKLQAKQASGQLVEGEVNQLNSLIKQRDDLFKINYGTPKSTTSSFGIEFNPNNLDNVDANISGLQSKISAIDDQLNNANISMMNEVDQKALESTRNNLLAEVDNLNALKNAPNARVNVSANMSIDPSKEYNPYTMTYTDKPKFIGEEMPVMDAWNKRKTIDSNAFKGKRGNQSYMDWIDSKEAMKARGEINNALDVVVPEAAPLRQNYQTALDFQSALDPFTDPKKLNSALSNIDATSNRMFRDKTTKILADNGVDVKGLADKVQAYDAFNDPTWLGKNLKYRVQGQTLGDITADAAAAGQAQIAPTYSLIKAAAALGRGAGNIAAGPKMTKAIIDYNRGVYTDILPQKMQPYVKYLPTAVNQNNFTRPMLEYIYEQNNSGR